MSDLNKLKERKPDGGLADLIQWYEMVGEDGDPELLCLLLELRRRRFKSTEQAELEAQLSTAIRAIDNLDTERNALRAHLAELAKQEPEYFLNRIESSDKWGKEVELRIYESQLDASKSKDDHGGGIIELFSRAAQPAALPPEKLSLNNGVVGFNEGYNQAIADAKALGVKPLRVRLPERRERKTGSMSVGELAHDMSNGGFNEALWECEEALKSQGIEVEE